MEIIVDESKNGQSIELSLKDSFHVDLAENPSTGYKWVLSHLDSDRLDLTGSHLLSLSRDRTGSGGARRFSFRPKTTGKAKVDLMLRRVWEGESANIARFTCNVCINDQSHSIREP